MHPCRTVRVYAWAITTCFGLSLVYGQAQPAGGQSASAVPADVQELISALSSEKTSEQIAAIEKLGAMGSRAAAAIPHLVPILRYQGLESIKIGDQMVTAFDLSADAAAETLARIGKPALRPLQARLGDPDAPEDGRYWAAVALARMNDPAATSLLLTTLKDPASPAGADVARALEHSADPQALNTLLSLATSSNPELRAAAIAGLRTKKDPRAVDALVASLQDKDPRVRQAAARGLMAQADPRTLDSLIRALKDDDSRVRNYCAQALGNIKDRRAIEPLIEVVTKDTESLVRFQAGRALEAITGLEFGENGDKWLKWWQEQAIKKP